MYVAIACVCISYHMYRRSIADILQSNDKPAVLLEATDFQYVYI